LLLSLILLAFGVSSAQETSSDTCSKSKTRAITGCRTKGDNSASSNEYQLTANDGSTWEVPSHSVALSKHVGQEVTATGTVANDTMHNRRKKGKPWRMTRA
jgi:hypothetical protein